MGMKPSRSTKDLDVVLGYLLGRRLTMLELLDALEMPRSTYYQCRTSGTLTSADNLLRAARNLDLNTVDLLVRFGHLTPAEVAAWAAKATDAAWAGLHPQDGAPPL